MYMNFEITEEAIIGWHTLSLVEMLPVQFI